MTVKTLSVACPTCKKEVLMTPKSKYRPFCSDRCKLIDLGDWASENHRIPGKSLEDDVWSENLEGEDLRED